MISAIAVKTETIPTIGILNAETFTSGYCLNCVKRERRKLTYLYDQLHHRPLQHHSAWPSRNDLRLAHTDLYTAVGVDFDVKVLNGSAFNFNGQWAEYVQLQPRQGYHCR